MNIRTIVGGWASGCYHYLLWLVGEDLGVVTICCGWWVSLWVLSSAVVGGWGFGCYHYLLWLVGEPVGVIIICCSLWVSLWVLSSVVVDVLASGCCHYLLWLVGVIIICCSWWVSWWMLSSAVVGGWARLLLSASCVDNGVCWMVQGQEYTEAYTLSYQRLEGGPWHNYSQQSDGQQTVRLSVSIIALENNRME